VDDEPEHDHAPRLDVAVPDLEAPDICVFDLDPSDDDAADVRAAAIGCAICSSELGLRSWIKTTGSKASTSSCRSTARPRWSGGAVCERRRQRLRRGSPRIA
jgi:DNA primase